MIQKSGAFLLVVVKLYRQEEGKPKSVLVQGKKPDLSVDLVKVRHRLLVGSGAAVCDSCPNLVSLIGFLG